jgi:nucleotide-binding universal stress UspA family protein
MVLVCYDGSADADAAIDEVAGLMPGAETVVLTVWEPFVDVLIGVGATGMAPGPVSPPVAGPEIDTANRKRAAETADAGTARAQAAGLRARPLITGGPQGAPTAILEAAEELDADVIVVGTRGLGGVKSYLLGSISHSVLQHADRAVLVVPSPELSVRRRGWGKPA